MSTWVLINVWVVHLLRLLALVSPLMPSQSCARPFGQILRLHCMMAEAYGSCECDVESHR